MFAVQIHTHMHSLGTPSFPALKINFNVAYFAAQDKTPIMIQSLDTVEILKS